MPKDKKDISPSNKANLARERKLFGKSAHAYFVLKKAERLASAIYLVTEMFPAGDPLRDTLRSRALKVLSLMAQGGGVNSTINETLFVVRGYVSEVIGMLHVASVAGEISSMNEAVLEREYRLFLEFLMTHGSAYRPLSKEFDKEFFDIPGESVWESEDGKHAGLWYAPDDKGHVSHNASVPDNFRSVPTSRDASMNRRKFVSNGSVESAERHSTRRSSILGIVGRKGRISVKDIAQHIKDCSEKTLQRELLALVAEGVLKKEGERRWSTYVLA